MQRYTLLFALALTAGLCQAVQAMEFENIENVPAEEGGSAGAGYPGLVALPEGYTGSGDEAWPLILFLHGSGEQGREIERVRVHGPWEYVAEAELPVIIAAPQTPWGGWKAEHLGAFLDTVRARYRVDAKRIYLTGLSMGGKGAYRLAAAQPETFAAVVVICGRSEPEEQAKALAGLPVWIFHGDRDSIVPIEESEQQVAAIRAAGGEPRYTVYEGVNHISWTQTYNDPELYAWLLKQRRE